MSTGLTVVAQTQGKIDELQNALKVGPAKFLCHQKKLRVMSRQLWGTPPIHHIPKTSSQLPGTPSIHHTKKKKCQQRLFLKKPSLTYLDFTVRITLMYFFPKVEANILIHNLF